MEFYFKTKIYHNFFLMKPMISELGFIKDTSKLLFTRIFLQHADEFILKLYIKLNEKILCNEGPSKG